MTFNSARFLKYVNLLIAKHLVTHAKSYGMVALIGMVVNFILLKSILGNDMQLTINGAEHNASLGDIPYLIFIYAYKFTFFALLYMMYAVLQTFNDMLNPLLIHNELMLPVSPLEKYAAFLAYNIAAHSVAGMLILFVSYYVPYGFFHHLIPGLSAHPLDALTVFFSKTALPLNLFNVFLLFGLIFIAKLVFKKYVFFKIVLVFLGVNIMASYMIPNDNDTAFSALFGALTIVALALGYFSFRNIRQAA